MNKKTWGWFLVGSTATILFLIGIAFDYQWMRLICKPIPVLCLAGWLATDRWGSSYAKWVVIGLLFSALGDILLEIPAKLFVYGLLAFLVAHLCYIKAYLSDTKTIAWKHAIPYFLYGVGLCGFLFTKGRVGALSIPVAIYAAVICSMLWRASARMGNQSLSRATVQLALVGAIVFAISDSAIAISRFYMPFEGSRYVITSTYLLGQLGIALSVSKKK
jgi:uncharacterized membrane protein YhhN